jgi:arylsulfatase
VQDQRLHYAHNYLARAIYRVSSADPLPEGSHRLRFEFEPTGEPDIARGRGAPGRAQLYVDDDLVGQAEFPVTVPIMFSPGGLSCGANPGAPILAAYRSPFRFTGVLRSVTVDLSGELILDSAAEMRVAMSRQ